MRDDEHWTVEAPQQHGLVGHNFRADELDCTKRGCHFPICENLSCVAGNIPSTPIQKSPQEKPICITHFNLFMETEESSHSRSRRAHETVLASALS